LIKQKKTNKEKRIEAILDAGLALALASGLKSTTMEAIAKEANISKATLYSYFPDKQAIFASITARLFVELKQLVEISLEKNCSLGDKIALALASKNKVVFSLFITSSHKEEIISKKSKFAKKEVAQFENYLQQKIASILSEAGHSEPQKYAQILIACSEGISSRATNVSQIGPAIRLVVNKLLD